jgi:hypothetical protein
MASEAGRASVQASEPATSVRSANHGRPKRAHAPFGRDDILESADQAMLGLANVKLQARFHLRKDA